MKTVEKAALHCTLKENLEYEVLSDFSLVCAHYESVALKCSGTLVACIYRHPSSETAEFIQFMRDLLEYAVL